MDQSSVKLDVDKPFLCKICSKSFLQNGNLLIHIKSVHDDIRPHKCSICDSAFHLKSAMNIHVKTVHDGEI